MEQKHDVKTFFRYIIPSVLSFALSGVYAIVDGFFVGNSLGDIGLSVVTIAYPIVAFIQAVGTGLGMGGAIYYSIYRAEKKEHEARMFTAGALWLMLASSVILTVLVLLCYNPLLQLLGATGNMLAFAEEYIVIITVGTALQIFGTGLVPFIRNLGGSFYAMIAMIAGFITNIILDYLFVWVWGQGVAGSAIATVIGQGVTMLIALAYILRKKQFTLKIPISKAGTVSASILKIGGAPFGLDMSPNISLIIINRFSASYGGEPAIATYACIGYMICIIYLVFQGVGDGSQPLISQYYGERDFMRLKSIRRLAYSFTMLLAIIGCIVMYLTRGSLGLLFGTSNEVNTEVAKIIPIFLVSVPFVAIVRVTTASFYASKKNALSYVLTFIEPILMLTLMLILPPLFGGQIMIWWSTVIARILSAILALILKSHVDRHDLSAIPLRGRENE